ncbi:MAG TPA: hypothetical protein VG496_00910 [Myxococcales bacterium]|nr:hypothetical protein [Myxococcales bacterium]
MKGSRTRFRVLRERTPWPGRRTVLAGPFVAVALAVCGPVSAQDRHLVLPAAELEQVLRSEPLRIVSAQISRPKAKGDITLKAEVAFGDRQPMRTKLRRAEPGAETFNNVPRYDLAAYELQKLLMGPAEYVVPPTALRMVPLADLRRYAPQATSTFEGADDVLCVIQYWLQDVVAVRDVLDPALFRSDPVYARHVGQLNVFTYLIRHGDSNVGNFLISAEAHGERVFAIDNGVAFASEESDRGHAWRSMRVDRIPADVVERLRKLTENDLTSHLGVVAQWQLTNGHYVAVPVGENLAPGVGIRRDGKTVQMGLTRREIAGVWDRAKRLVKMIDDHQIASF